MGQGESKPKSSKRNVPLDADAWVQAALGIIADRGVDGIRVDSLARELGVTKGSFYHHFEDRQALLSAVMNYWRRQATTAIIATLEDRHEQASVRLQKLMRLPYSGRRSQRDNMLDLSMRLWSRHDPTVNAALEEIDALRLRFIAGLLEENGVASKEARARAIILYSYLRVSPTLISPKETDILATCEAFICTP